ncbi:MAG: hypothetical protein ACRDIX_11395 [Actinomycetota bacterium]
MELLFQAVVFVGLLIGAGLSLYLRAQRRLDFVTFAANLGFRYSRSDPFGLPSLPFRLFTRGVGRRADNVAWGSWQGTPITVFDFAYYEEVRNPTNWWWKHRVSRRFSCAMVEVADAAFPRLRVFPEGFLSRLADHVGFSDIEMESEEFNRRYQVLASERRFAYELIDARMVRWFLALERPVSFEVVGKWILAYHERVRPRRLLPLIGSVAGFRERLPRVALSLYGIGGKEERES